MQVPTEVPTPSQNSPIDPSSPVELVIFIALPILLIAVYIILRKRKKEH